MKFVSVLAPVFLSSALLVGCAHVNEHKVPQLSDFSPEQIEQMNRDALAIASKRLEEMVIQAKSNQSSVNYLSTDLFLKANMSLLEGDYATAVVLFKHVVSLVPNDDFLQKKICH